MLEFMLKCLRRENGFFSDWDSATDYRFSKQKTTICFGRLELGFDSGYINILNTRQDAIFFDDINLRGFKALSDTLHKELLL